MTSTENGKTMKIIDLSQKKGLAMTRTAAALSLGGLRLCLALGECAARDETERRGDAVAVDALRSRDRDGRREWGVVVGEAVEARRRREAEERRGAKCEKEARVGGMSGSDVSWCAPASRSARRRRDRVRNGNVQIMRAGCDKGCRVRQTRYTMGAGIEWMSRWIE